MALISFSVHKLSCERGAAGLGHHLQNRLTLLNRGIDCDMIGGVIVDLGFGDIVECAALYDDTGRMSKKRHVGVASYTAREWGESKAKVDSVTSYSIGFFFLFLGYKHQETRK